jgi:transposase
MPRKQKYPVKLSAVEQAYLENITRTGKHSAKVIRRAQILLWSNAGKADKEIIDLLGCAPMTVSSTRARWVRDHRLEDATRRGRSGKLDAKQAALLVALACSDAPDGRADWTMQLLADKLVELKVVETISDETVRRTLKKTNSNPGNTSSGVSQK